MALPTINTKTFTFDSNPSADSARYTGAGHTAAVKDFFQVRRVAPKPTKTSKGVMKEYHKRVISELIDGVYQDTIVETSYSIPVGTSAATVTAARADNAAFATSTAGIALVEKAQVNF